MKKQILLLAMMLLPMVAGAYSGNAEINGLWYLIVTKVKEAKVISCQNGKYSGDIVIPATVKYEGITCEVNAIDGSAFSGCTDLTSVTILSNISSIASNTFYSCSSLTSVMIPNGVTSIGNGAFRGCSSLTSDTIPNSVTSIENTAFYGCSGLSSVTISNSVTIVFFYVREYWAAS